MKMDKFMFSRIAILMVLILLCCSYVTCQTYSAQDPECLDNTTCPCCINGSCPSDNSGQCNGNCIDGYHGGKCLNMCPFNCRKCIDASRGVANCTLCKNGYFSTESLYQCQQHCSTNCSTCESESSKCTSCSDGYFFNKPNSCIRCNKPCLTCNSSDTCFTCEDGYFLNQQYSCEKCDPICYSCSSNETCICSIGCSEGFPGICNKETKNCLSDCKENFTSSNGTQLCDTCKNGNYGYNCDLLCNLKCKNSQCERITGACFACTEGNYGINCNITCPEKCTSNCDMYAGNCASCKDGYYGINCTIPCHDKNCKICNITDGSCTTCKNDFFGSNCHQNCPDRCFHNTCDMADGSCTCVTGYTGPSCEVLITSLTVSTLQSVVSKDPSNFAGQTVGGTLAGVVVMVSVVTAIILIYKKRRAFKYVRYHIDFDSYKLDAWLIDVLEENDDFDPTYFTGKVDDTKKPCGKLPVKELGHFVETRGDEFYQDEFLKLPRGLIKSFDDAKKEENVVKNRYTGIYPYDEHRVRLQPPGSDFINACYIDGYRRKKEYIASLGPTRKAMEGFQLFWRMVWQEKADVIVMVTNLMEGQSMKCEQYWPDIGMSATYGEITVTSQTEDVHAEFVVRALTVTKDREQRTLHHLHYTAWPDKRVPDDVTSLIEFRQKVNTIGLNLGGPTIVHCSAGIGRTGTYIALDILIHQGKTQKTLDIFEWVTRMREQRTSMVQTWLQYEYIHRALVHALTFHCEPVKKSKIGFCVESLNDKKMTRLFKQLHRKHEKPTEDEQEARNMNKGLEGMNREGADIPGSMHRPFLHLDKNIGENNYINAIFLNSYIVKDRFLVCQTPLPDTVKDFLTLIIQESCSCIVSMDPPGLKDQTIGEYYPATSGTMFSHPSYIFDVEAQDLDTNPSYKLRRITIHFNKRSGPTSRTVYHFQFQNWPQGNRVPDVSHFLQLVQDVDNMADRGSDRGPILVHCLNAAERSCLYCAVSNLVQKMKVEGEVSVVNTLRQVKFRRPLAIPNKDQYMFCYRCLHQFVTSQSHTNDEAVYGNIE